LGWLGPEKLFVVKVFAICEVIDTEATTPLTTNKNNPNK
jgi:hypothetical protein